jgi:predicted GNAT family acetyltransferase
MKLIAHKNAKQFLFATEKFLLNNEVANCVMLGSAIRMRDKPSDKDHGTYFASIEQDGKITAAAMLAPKRPLGLTPMQAAQIKMLADDLLQRKMLLENITADPQSALNFAQFWSKINSIDYIQEYGLRIYQLQSVYAPLTINGRMRLATAADASLAAEWAEAFDSDVNFGDVQGIRDMVLIAIAENRLYFWDDEKPVSMLLRNAPTPNTERVSVVYTPPEYRGKGYAAAANSALAQIILDSGKRYACLFADVDNPVSNKMYLNIGYEMVCDVHRYKFLPHHNAALRQA